MGTFGAMSGPQNPDDRGTERAPEVERRQRPFWLTFRNRDIEASYRLESDRESRGRVRLAGVLAVALYAAFGFLDTQVARSSVGSLWVIRFGFVCPFILMLLALSYTRLADHLQQFAICATTVLATVGFDVMNVLPGVPTAYSYSGTMLTLIFLCTFTRVRFTMCVPTVAIVVVAYEASELARGVRGFTVLFNGIWPAAPGAPQPAHTPATGSIT